jgi:hypothetical protein
MKTTEEVYTVHAAVDDAITCSDNEEWKAELYLCTVLKDPLSKNYTQAVKKISKVALKRAKLIKKLKKKPMKGGSEKLRELEDKLISLLEIKKYAIDERVSEQSGCIDSTVIAKGLLARYHGGMMAKDAVNRIITRKSAYGRLVRTVYHDLCPDPMLKKLISKVARRKTPKNPFKRDRKSHWNNKQIASKEQAILVEQAFVLYLLTKALEDFSEEEIRQMLDEIAAEVQSEDETLANKIRDIKNTVNITKNISKVALQIVRLCIGKGVFMNASVKITNVMLRVVWKKGMTYPQNAVFRKWFAKLLGKGRINIAITVALFIPDVFALFHRRNRANVTTAMLLMYQMRHAGSV